jgi:Domain of unknown function (DUF4396)
MSTHIHAHHPAPTPTLDRLALSATLHCLTGCSIGEILGMVIGSTSGMAAGPTIALSVALAFFFGYLLTMLPLLRSGMAFRSAAALALASDTVSITIMEIVDNAVMLAIPGAMDAGPGDFLFWGSMSVALVLAGVVTFPVIRGLIARGKGHALVHSHHGGHAPSGTD